MDCVPRYFPKMVEETHALVKPGFHSKNRSVYTASHPHVQSYIAIKRINIYTGGNMKESKYC